MTERPGRSAMKKHNRKRGQRKHEQKVARRKAALAGRSGPNFPAPSLVHQARAVASTFRVNYCMISEAIFDIGLGYVVLGRAKSPTTVTTAILLVDVYCLGVKNGIYADYTRQQFLEALDGLSAIGSRLVDIDPACARKMLAGAVAYAKQLGFAPHEDYPPAEALFGDIDAALCPTEHVFGKDGKPFYVSGPQDTPAKIRKIMRTLTQRAGEGNFDYLVTVDEL